MGTDIYLPMYSASVASRHFDEQLWPVISASLPDLGADGSERSVPILDTLLGYLDFKFSGAVPDYVDALHEAFLSTGLATFSDSYLELNTRLEWLRKDLAAAPLLTSEAVEIRDAGSTRRSRENRRLVLTGPNIEWHSFGYLLGVLMSEMVRLHDVCAETIQRIDSTGKLDLEDLGSDGLEIVGSTVDSILAGDQGRSFVGDPRWPNEEFTHFQELRKLLDR